MSKEWSPETVFDVLASEETRKILALASVEAMSAQEFATYLDSSEPTIYRRLDVLQDYDFVSADTQIDDQGHHYNVYRTSLERIEMEVTDGQFRIDIELERDLVDQFEQFWNDLERGEDGARATDDPFDDDE